MKRIFIPFFIVILCISGNIFAQIPNAGFENWSNGDPDDWTTNNVPPILVTITQTSSAHSGSSALQGAVVSFSGTPISPALILGSDGNGIPYTDRPGSLHGYYKLTVVGNDMLAADAVFIKNDAMVGGTYITLGAAGSYTEFATDITWITADNPDTVYINFVIVNNSGDPHVGTIFYLDDLSFSNATDVKTENNPLTNFELVQNYPNPFNPSTVIKYSIPKESFVTLKIYNLLGQEIAALVNEDKPAGTYNVKFSTSDINAGKLTSGIYLYRITAGNFVQTKKMMLLK